MKNVSISKNQQLSPELVASLLDAEKSALVSHIATPIGISNQALKNKNELSHAFTETIKNISNFHSDSHKEQQIRNELCFGAPQIDLALPKGTFTTNTLHEINPKHWRDQNQALSCALTLLKREKKQTGQPIFCFLLDEDQEAMNWLSDNNLREFNLIREDLIIITAKHSDDLAWAMEETMHITDGALIVAHFNMLANITSQRLSFVAKTNQATCFVICNHQTEDTKHCQTQWSISKPTDLKDEELRLTLEHSNNQDLPFSKPPSWSLKWSTENKRFVASLESGTPATLH